MVLQTNGLLKLVSQSGISGTVVALDDRQIDLNGDAKNGSNEAWGGIQALNMNQQVVYVLTFSLFS